MRRIGSAISQLVRGEKFDVKKALGSAANGAIVGAVKGALIGSGAGIGLSLVSDFAAGTAGSAIEQKISTGDVSVSKSLAGGFSNAVSGAIYGNSPLKSVKQAFRKGAASGAATSGINYLADTLGNKNSSGSSSQAGKYVSAKTSPYAMYNDQTE